MSRRRILVSVAAAGLVAGLVWPSPAAAADVADVGWWSRNPGQSAPAGGMAVASAPDGEVSVSAIRIDLDTGVVAAQLTAVETGGVAQSSAELRVCRTTNNWQAVEGGDLGDAPAPECAAGEVQFVRDADAASWSADVTPLVVDGGGIVSLAIVPAEPDAPIAAAFDVRFAAPEVASTPAPPPPAPVEVFTPSEPSGFGGGSGGQPAGGSSFGFGPEPSSGAPTFAPASPSGVPTPAAESPDPQTAESDDGSVPDADDEVAIPPLVPTASSDTPNPRTVGKALTYVLLSALAGLAVGGGSRIARLRSLA